jgi:hypothetical protein
VVLSSPESKGRGLRIGVESRAKVGWKVRRMSVAVNDFDSILMEPRKFRKMHRNILQSDEVIYIGSESFKLGDQFLAHNTTSIPSMTASSRKQATTTTLIYTNHTQVSPSKTLMTSV